MPYNLRMTKTNLLTVVIPTYNRLTLLKQSISSLENQTIKGFRVLILDNNSNDGTVDYLKNLKSSSFEIELVFRNQNIGYFQNLLDGINLVRTKYISFLSDDNEYLPNCLERLLLAINENNDTRVVIGSHNLMTFDRIIKMRASKRNNAKYGRKSKLSPYLKNKKARELQLQKKIICIDSAMFLTDQLRSAALIEKHGLDFTLFSQYLLLGGAARYISDPIMNYRENPEGISQNSNSQVSFANYVIESCNELIRNNRFSNLEITWIKNEIFRYQYILMKHDLIKPRILMRNFKFNSNLNSYKLMMRLPIILSRKFLHKSYILR